MESFHFDRPISDFDRSLFQRLFIGPWERSDKKELETQREALKAHFFKDYWVQIDLATATPSTFKILLTDTGYDFVLSSIRTSYTGTLATPPMFHVRDRGHGYELFRGELDYPGFVSCFDAGPGSMDAPGHNMGDPMEKKHFFGNRATIEIGAMMHPSDTETSRTVHIILSGWSMSSNMLIKTGGDARRLAHSELRRRAIEKKKGKKVAA